MLTTRCRKPQYLSLMQAIRDHGMILVCETYPLPPTTNTPDAENLTKISLNDAAALHPEMDQLIFAKCISKLFTTNDQFICFFKSLLFITVYKSCRFKSFPKT